MDDQTIFLLASKDFYQKQLPKRDAKGYILNDGQIHIINELESAGLRNLVAKKSHFAELQRDTDGKNAILDNRLAKLTDEYKIGLKALEDQAASIQQQISNNETDADFLKNKFAERGFNLEQSKAAEKPVLTSRSSPKSGLFILLVLLEIVVNVISYFGLREFLGEDQVWMRIGGNIIIIGLLFYADKLLAGKLSTVRVSYFLAGTLLLLSSIFSSVLLNEMYPMGDHAQASVWVEAGSNEVSTPKFVGIYRALPWELILCSILLMVLTKIGSDKKPEAPPVEEATVKKLSTNEKAQQMLQSFIVKNAQLQAAEGHIKTEISELNSNFKQNSDVLLNEKDRLANDLKRAKEEFNTFETQVAIELKSVFDALKTYEREYLGLNISAIFDAPTEEDIMKYYSLTKTINLLK